MKIRTLIIDDEHLNRDLIEKLVNRFNENFEIVGKAENVEDAFCLINKLVPDLIFLDIKMPDGSGFDLLKRFEKTNFEVVFITGFDEYALSAFEFNAIDYLLKPIDINKLKNMLVKVHDRISQKLSLANNLKDIITSYNYDDKFIKKIPIHQNDKVVLLNVCDIIIVASEDGCTKFKTVSNEVFLASKQLSSFDFIMGKLPNFIRINRSIYLNANYIRSYSKGSVCNIVLKNEEIFEISRRKKNEVLQLLKGFENE
jgi:two-component system LytT family response regulator